MRIVARIQKEANFSFMKGLFWGFGVSMTCPTKSSVQSKIDTKEMYFHLSYMTLVLWREMSA